MAKFELVSKYAGQTSLLPVRKTAQAAGYDFVVAEDIIIPPMEDAMDDIYIYAKRDLRMEELAPIPLGTMNSITKLANARPTLIPTGVKCKLDPDTYLELSVRSSCPLKYWLILANGVGIIDGDYYNNVDNEGHIFFQLINLSPIPISLHKGDAIGQGIIKPFLKAEDDSTSAIRTGGFGSTDKNV